MYAYLKKSLTLFTASVNYVRVSYPPFCLAFFYSSYKLTVYFPASRPPGG